MSHKLYPLIIAFVFVGANLAIADTNNQVAVVLMTQGDVSAKDASGNSRPLARRSQVMLGDEITVGEKSKAQLRYTDSTLMTLGEKSTFKVDKYQYKEKDNDAFLSKLAQGTLRALPGAIDKSHQDAVNISTPVAVMGVRGTLFSLGVAEKGTSVAFFQGSGWLKNESGTLTLGEGSKFDFAFIGSTHDIAGQGRLSEPTELMGLEQGRSGTAQNVGSITTASATVALSPLQLKAIVSALQKYNSNDKRPILKLWDRQVELRSEGLDCQCSL